MSEAPAEIEVTPAMIEAGEKALLEKPDHHTSETVASIYREMVRARFGEATFP